MKICFMCDLHLPSQSDALQYDVLKWAIDDIVKKAVDCIVFAGDVTCNGDEDVYKWFVKTINSTGIPFFYIPGNSDMRNPNTRDRILKMSSPCINEIGGITIVALNDCNGDVADAQLDALNECPDGTVVFMHHPMDEHDEISLHNWSCANKKSMIFYGHEHRSYIKDNIVSLQAMDPDKAIGENPCITYYDTETGAMRKAYYFCPPPADLYHNLGISCYRAGEQIQFAIDRGLKNIELRPNCINTPKEHLAKLVLQWRASGGENLSVHLPDVSYKDGTVSAEAGYDELIEIVKLLRAERITQHVPLVSVAEVSRDAGAIDAICDYMAQRFNSISHNVVIGVENMHMTSKDTADENRRFGYVPEECLAFMNKLSEKSNHKVGINFDIGHARNNAPYSQHYQISTWFAMLGRHIVGYHMHQVTYDDGVFENHMPITHVYGKLISYASFFRCWSEGRINKAPVVFEMRPEGAYDTTLKAFEAYKSYRVFDLHSHTYYSNCGRDTPRDLIDVAIVNGLSVLGISDHNYGIGDRKDEYRNCIRNLADEYKDKITILCGIEIATLPHLYDIRCRDEIANYDYCLIEHISEDNSIAGEDLFGFCKKLNIPCGIAHTDLFAYCDSKGYDYSEFFGKMAEHNVFWEMNVSYDSIHHYKEHQYVQNFMQDKSKIDIIKKSGVYISVGFDSHRCEDYDGFKVHDMYGFLNENKINTADKLLIK